MSEPIESLYFNWLRAKVTDLNTPPYLYLDLMKVMYRTEFNWWIVGDRNRLEDGKELREHFLNETGETYDERWFRAPCSVLEVLIAFANRAAFQTDETPTTWFYQFLINLELDNFREITDDEEMDIVSHVLERWIWRAYDESGYGGLFPLREPKEDQRRIELWYQFFAYLDDQGLV